MRDPGFEWDDAKAAKNEARHGVSFKFARNVFGDPFAIERLDDREDYGETRFVITGMVEGVVLSVAYSEQDGRIRLISARQATRVEQDDYFTESG